MFDDAIMWMNYVDRPSPCEISRLQQLIGDKKRADDLLKFGLRPASVLDNNPCFYSFEPFNVMEEHLLDPLMLVDTMTGFRFSYKQLSDELIFVPYPSNNYMDGIELLAHLRNSTNLTMSMNRECNTNNDVSIFSYFYPCEFKVGEDGTLDSIIDGLQSRLLGNYRVNRIWYRGQRTEYTLNRDPKITKQLYGRSYEPSLIPSLGRFVINNPSRAGYNLQFYGNHSWKKPFLIWMILQNEKPFRLGSNHINILNELLSNPNDDDFTNFLCEFQLPSSIFEVNCSSTNIDWPDEVDDLRQWFFSSMKRQEFGITLQQYGYPSSLLDVTDSLDVALYFTQSRMVDGRFQLEDPQKGRVLYVFAERDSGDFFRHGSELFWGDHNWCKDLPPRLLCQKAGFIKGSSCRAQNFYSKMLIAKIWLDENQDFTKQSSDQLFPYENDLLYDVLRKSKPSLSDLY